MMVVIVAVLVLVATSAVAEGSSDCKEYEAKLKSRPDLTHKVVVAKSTLPSDYTITNVLLDEELSFYWCEMTVDDINGNKKTLRRFGHNATHWWVTHGCGGSFQIQACRGAYAPFVQNTVDPVTTPTIVITIPAPVHSSHGESKTTLHFEDVNSEALMTLVAWLKDNSAKGTVGEVSNIRDKLGGNHDNMRSIDEEFALEFGTN